jgi:hypothetical protein
VPDRAGGWGQAGWGQLAVNRVMRGTITTPGMNMATKNATPGGDG